MEILNLIQGSEEWKAARLDFLCASEAPPMMGESKFMSRGQLLDLKKGWQSNPVSSFKAKLYENGHASEDAGREILEIEECEEYPPVVGFLKIDGLELLASYDGLEAGIEGGTPWEHKEWNAVLSENVRNSVFEPLYYWQLEHQMVVAGVDHVLFTCSDGTEENRVSAIYRSIPERRAQLIAGWKQFMIDLDNHEIEAKKESVVARVQSSFPAIECRVEGSMVVSNLGDYIPLIKNLADEQMGLVLESDQDFIDKAAFNKNVKAGRASLKIKAGEIETQFESLSEFNGFVKQADTILQKLQSHGEKQVEESKEAKKLAITNGAHTTLQDHLGELSATIKNIPLHGIGADWNAVIKGKRSFDKMEEAVDAEIAKLKIQANEMAAVIRKNLDTMSEMVKPEHRPLFSDWNDLVIKGNEDLVNLIKMRIAEHEQAEAARLEQIQKDADERARVKAKKESDEKLEEDRLKIRKEEQNKARADAKSATPEPVQEQAAKASAPARAAEPVSETQAAVTQELAPAEPQQPVVNDEVIANFLSAQLNDVTDFGWLLVSDDPQLNGEALQRLKAKFQNFLNR